jgi:hypothetical protein
MRNSLSTNRPLPAGGIASVRAQLSVRIRRLDRRRLTAIAVALMVAVVTRQALVQAAAIEAGLGTRARVVVALTDLRPGAVIEASQVHVEMWPVDMVPPGSIDDVDLTLGLTVRSAIATGEPVVSSRTQPGTLGLAPEEVGVTLSQPLALPPLQVGQIVQLVGIRGSQERQLASASVLGAGRVVSFTDDELTVAVSPQQMPQILEHAAVGSVEVVITPQRG